MRRIAVVIGGTFAPITRAHIEMGVWAREIYPAADIIYIPSNLSYISRWKEVSTEDVFGDRYRLRLIENAIAPYGFLVNTMEAQGLAGGTTYESVRRLKAAGYEEVVWCIGADKLEEVSRWHRAEELFREMKFLLFFRGETGEGVGNDFAAEIAEVVNLGEAFRDISSTKIREAYEKRDFETIERMAPETVCDFLREAEKDMETEKDRNAGMTREEQLESALRTLEQYVHELAAAAGKSGEYADELWQRIKNSTGVLRELAYYHDNDAFWDGYEVAGYHFTDILVWQVDHFKAYLDRHEEVKRWHPEELFLSALDIMLQMERDPQPFIDKMKGETGTDYVGKY